VSVTLGIWPVRVEAERLGERLARQLGGELFRPWERAEAQKAQFQAWFDQRSHWVLIMAVGIATRFVEGLLRDKHSDPAVVVLDEAGRYAVPLLGGHEAGANALAYRVANVVGAIPVVTTATEAVRRLVIGIGCRKGVSEEQVGKAILHALAGFAGATGDLGVLRQVREIVTVDLKAQEPGLIAFSHQHGIPLRVIAKQQIEARSWVTRPSNWVKQSVGLEGVCEPCALIACTRGKLVVPKTTLDGVAVAVVEDDWELVP
jgi:cobalt-precorrin 5A hydrolase